MLWCYVMVKMARIDIAVNDLIHECQDEQLESCCDVEDDSSPWYL